MALYWQDVLLLQASIVELAQLYNDLSMLIEYQGSQIDSIEVNVSPCED
jgi:t-SNARE complex subunit (syntaxin)